MKRHTGFLLVGIIVLALAASMALSGCSAAAKLQEYDFDTDKIPTINSVVGERKVTGVETSTTNGVPQKQYTYESTTVRDDLIAYTSHLLDNGWLVTQDIDYDVTPGSAQLGKESVDSGKLLVLSIAYQDTHYAIKITKTEGTLDVQ